MAAELHIKTGSSNTAPYETWAKGLTTFAAAASALAAGDTLWGSAANYAESVAGVNVTIPGTSSAITRLISGTEGATSGITAVGAGASITTTNATFTLAGSFYADTWAWKSTGASSCTMTFAGTSGNQQYHKTCSFDMGGNSAAGSSWVFGSGSSSASTAVELEAPTFKFGNAAHRIAINGSVNINGGSIDAAGTAPSGLFTLSQANRPCKLRVNDFDASAGTSGLNIVTSITQSGVSAEFSRWKMPAGWTGGLLASGQLKRGDRLKLADYSIGTTLYKLWVEDYAGSIKDEPTIKVTANPYSYKVATTADCSIIAPMRGPKYDVPLSGSSQTVTIDICTDNVTLKDSEACIEVEYFAASGSSLGTITSDAVASIIATPADQASSSTTWTTTGLTTPIKQALAVTLTAGRASRAVVRPIFRKASLTVYCDNVPQVA